MKENEPQLPHEQLTMAQTRRRTIKSMLLLGASMAGGWSLFNWVKHQPATSGTPGPLRQVLTANESIFKKTFSESREAKEYTIHEAVANVRVNGQEGLRGSFNEEDWQLTVQGLNRIKTASLGEIKALPKREIIFDFKCIEGWSMITRWAGVPLKIFLDHFGLQQEQSFGYIGLQTPDKQYYVGIDMPSALHPQTLLCYEMNGQPLQPLHGAPLRLIIPVKYGVKHLKRIGNLYFSNTKPADYWAERGYDYYAGH